MDLTAPIASNGDWQDFLASPVDRNHSVQLYSDLEFLTRVASHYAGTGLAQGDAVILLATPCHRQALVQRLASDGLDAERFIRRGQLTILDAAETLSHLIVDGLPDAGLFLPLIGGIIDRARANGRFPRVRAYGEMVNLLWEKGELPAALRLEELWNELATTHTFSLHCAYAMDIFDRATHGSALHCIQHAHSHFVPVTDYSRLDDAVDRALADVLGPAEAIVLKPLLCARQRSGTRMPAAQAALQSLAEMLPSAADAVLPRVRRYYEAPNSGRS